jgi:hypothetical protein
MSDTIEPIAIDQAQLAHELVEQARAEGVELVGPGGLLTGLTKAVPDLADRLDHLAVGLEAHGESLDGPFHDAFVNVTSDAADACVEATGPDGIRTANTNTDIYTALGWCLMDLAVVRIGGYGTIEHSSNSSR